MPGTPRPTRREVVRLGLVAAAGASLAACTRGSDGSPAPTAPGGPKNYPDAKKLVTEDCIKPVEASA